MDTNKELLISNAEKYAKNRNVDPSRIDFKSILDKELSDGENWNRIRDKVEGLMDKEDVIEAKAEEIDEDEIQAKVRNLSSSSVMARPKKRKKFRSFTSSSTTT